MRKTPLQRKTPLRSKPKASPPKRERATLVVPSVVPKPVAVMAVIGVGKAQPKTVAHRDQRIRDSARGEECLIRIPGCPGGTERTIWSHFRGSAGGKGLGLKAGDVCGCYGCTYCDAVYDGQMPRPAGMSKADVDLAWHEGHIRSLGRLHEKGLI